MATTKIQSGAFPTDVVNTAAIDDLAVTHAKLHTTMDLSSKTVTLPTLNAKLVVVSPSSAEAINIKGRSADDIGQLKFYENDGTTSLARLDSRTTHFEVGSYNELRFSAGGVGNSHVVIDTSGNIFFGANKTANLAQVGLQYTIAGSLAVTRDGGGAFSLNRLTSDGEILGLWKDTNKIGYLGSNTSGGQSLLDISSENDASSNIRFLTYGSGSHNEVMRLASSGNVGIGDTGPTSVLSIQKNSTRTTDFENMLKITHTSSGTTGVGFGSAIYFLGERNNGVVQGMGRLIFDAEVNSGTNISSGFSVQTATAGAPSEKFRITHDGHAGIGETDTAKLQHNLGTLLNVNSATIIGNGSSGSYFAYNARYNNSWLRTETSGVGIISLTNSGKFTYRTAASGTAGTEPSLTEIIRTGDADPSYVTFDGASQVRLTLGNEGTPGTNTANWIRGNSGYLQYNSASNAHTWEVGGTERMRLHPGGTLHSIFGYSMRYIKTLNLTTSYQDVVDTGGGTPANAGWLIAMSSENNYHQAWVVTYSTNAIHGNYLGGDQGHGHSKDVQWRISGGHVQAKKSLSTGRPLTVFMVAGSLSADYG